MPQLRKDPMTSRWVIVNVENSKRPDEYPDRSHELSSKVCPFCPGNESMTPSEIAAFGRKSGPKDGAGWQVRVIPNKFPALRIEESTEKSAVGIYDRVGGFGAHEVIIENPDHHREIADLSVDEITPILHAYRDRCIDLKKDPRLKYILIFKNYGAEAGASLEHPHSQLIALPIIPSRVLDEVKGSSKHYEFTDRCVFCDILKQESTVKNLTILDDGQFEVIAPFVSRFPFEVWILPKTHEASFDTITDKGIQLLAKTMKTTLSKIKAVLKDPSYNFMIHTLPIYGKETESFHWHIEIIPHLTEVSGFELGTGFYLNPTTPESAAQVLRQQKV